MATAKLIPIVTEIDSPFEPAPERAIPWQIWATAIFLGLEGIGNLLSIPSNPSNAFWLAMKVLFITGLFQGWKPVYFLYLAIGALHVLHFSSAAPFVSFLNLVLVLLVLSSVRHFFPKHPRNRGAEVHIPRDLAKKPSARDWLDE